jgi:hypothetical protein
VTVATAAIFAAMALSVVVAGWRGEDWW